MSNLIRLTPENTYSTHLSNNYRTWSSRINYFEKNRQNLSSNLEHFILENTLLIFCLLSFRIPVKSDPCSLDQLTDLHRRCFLPSRQFWCVFRLILIEKYKEIVKHLNWDLPIFQKIVLLLSSISMNTILSLLFSLLISACYLLKKIKKIKKLKKIKQK